MISSIDKQIYSSFFLPGAGTEKRGGGLEEIKDKIDASFGSLEFLF